MFDKALLKKVLTQYKEVFVSTQWPDEKFKWEAIKHFQDNWDIKAPNFADMLTNSLAKTYGLLASLNNFPARMIQIFAEAAPEEVRAMFIALFDESKDVSSRILEFKEKSTVLLEKYGNGAYQHYQSENAISTYLWLRYPDKYYIYKFSEVKAVIEELKSDYVFKKGRYADNLRNFFNLYNEICEELQKDDELKKLLASQITDTCYPDKELRTLTVDVGFFISRTYTATANNSPWWPSLEQYNPKLSKEDWKKFILEIELPNHPSPMKMLKAMMEQKGEASCKDLATIYGGHPSTYVGCAVNLGNRAKKYFNLPPCMDGDKDRMFAIPFLGKSSKDNDSGYYIYKIRPELHEALKEIDLSDIDPYISTAENESGNYWWLNANPKIWSLSELEVGKTQSYTLYNENGNKRKIFQNFLDAKVGDMIIGYESNPVKQVVAICRVAAEQDGSNIYFEKIENLENPINYETLRNCPELQSMEFFATSRGSLFRLTKDEYDFIYDIIRDENEASSVSNTAKYSKADFLSQVYMDEIKYDTLVAVLENKKNIILQGAPGVGKTYAAKRLAYSLMGEIDENRVEFVQFHQNYSYEDFMMGYKPVNEGFELKYGIFYRFCQKAANQPDKKFFFIIDEINRGNMSKIFGELLMLIEKDYRGEKATLAYNGMSFSVPKNVYIIGMMNTADRSLAMIDYALRRRFSFFDMEPGFASEGFSKYQHSLNNDTFNAIIDKIQELNKKITLDKSLGKGFCIGHSYFCGQTECSEAWLRAVVEYDIIPMLAEYWFDEPAKLQEWENILRGVFQ